MKFLSFFSERIDFNSTLWKVFCVVMALLGTMYLGKAVGTFIYYITH